METVDREPVELEHGLSPARSVPVRGYGRIAARGFVWVFLLGGFGKVAGFLAQLVLGWLLSKDDYAVYAIAIAATSVFAAVRDAGLSRILIQRGKEYNALASPVLQLALIFNLAGAAMLVAAAPLVGRVYGTTELLPLMLVMAVTFVLATPAMVFEAKLLADLRFGRTVRIQAGSILLNYTSMIVFALLGLGPMSFVLPTVLVAIYETIASGISAGFLPNRKRLTWGLARDLIGSSIWIMMGTLAITLITQADYLVIGKLQAQTLGVYFFGCQMAIGFAAILGTGIRAVLMPTLSQFSDQVERFSSAYVHSVRTSTFLFMPFCVLAAVASPPLIDLCWSGKWNEARPVVVIMTLGLVFRMLTPVALAALEARGAWSMRAGLLWIDACGTIAGAIIGCMLGELWQIAACVAGSRAIMAVVQCIAAGWVSHARAGQVLGAIVPSTMLATGCGAIAWFATEALLPDANQWVSAAALGSLFAILFAAGSRLMMPARLEDAVKLIATLRPGRKQSVAINTATP
ncbi:MAG: oligosaccharide flippase family protein [Phycisphaerales bacterium]|nr:oligosaccharide flippase family protein [Phycisphaerales bacterium]MCI0629642.1 oligosaccharide flippase family protein [Phycisphaerales bacterium]MCI0674225.1 oligosaccharide flippase family protein [Phycisphaerales bacterium]